MGRTAALASTLGLPNSEVSHANAMQLRQERA